MKIKGDFRFEEVLSTIKKVMDFNPENYKFKPLRRRIWSRMRRLGINDYSEYSKLLLSDKNEVVLLKEALTINLTRFFRNKRVYDIMRNEILPGIESPVIWSAGCASGAEPYSLAIICSEINKDCKIIGTDIDKQSIENARKGIYNKFALKEIGREIRERHFDKIGKNYKIDERLKKYIEFRQNDLEDVDYRGEFDIIMCRNVLIYLNKQFQEDIFNQFYHALKDNGVLILGKVESLVGEAKQMFKPLNIKERIYEKK